METALVVCPHPEGLDVLKRIRSTRRLVVATDDPRVERCARSADGIADVTTLDRGESFWLVASDVKAIIERLEEWLASLDPSMPVEAVTWAGTIEGGLLGQRVQTGLLAIRSYQDLFRTLDVREVHAIADPDDDWDSEVLAAVARAQAIPLSLYKRSALRTAIRAFSRSVRPFGQAVYVAARELTLGFPRVRANDVQALVDGAVVFQLCSSARKHVDNVKYLMAALVDRGQRAVALCWTASDRFGSPSAAQHLSREGLDAVALERLGSLRRLAAIGWRVVNMAIRGHRRRGDLNAIVYRGVPLGPVIGESLRHFFVAVLPARLRYAAALGASLAGARPKAIKPWGGADLYEGRLALRLTAAAGARYVNYWVGSGMPGWPYLATDRPPDLFLAKSAAESDIVKHAYQIGDSRIAVVGQPRWTDATAFESHHSRTESRRRFNAPLDGAFYVGVDLGGTARGYRSRREQVDQLVAVLEAARSAPSMIVLLKPHPGHSFDHLMPYVKEAQARQVVVLPKASAVDHFLNAIDVVVTKYSTLLLEAALWKRCGIAALFDGEERFRVFGDLAAVAPSPADLRELLARIARDADFRRCWIAARLKAQAAELPRYYTQAPGEAAAVAAEAVIRHIDLATRAAARG